MDKKIHFPKGLIGLENYHDFTFATLPEQTQFWLLQSIEDKHFGLVVTNPFWFMPDYDFELTESETKQIGAKESLDVFVTINVASTPENITANLMGPIIMNQNTGIGLQTLLADKKYTTQYKILSAKLAGG
ncbi:flagellar assembly factor FliW [Pelosinus fermentans]|uniref:flagellar assembly protein FliW n=1 Tax=Pelosinus fermentans TaxID=365349 RepID=UPI0002685EA0|nr:flagellar assembly protein FliW [Pelosinus fermentans]OAM92843.1 Flagellar assembly factor fliW [Pelosinus fermentans DSM 17108]SDQ58650.1 flagellar assembly factor FliW [Pelosinus fermentans]